MKRIYVPDGKTLYPAIQPPESTPITQLPLGTYFVTVNPRMGFGLTRIRVLTPKTRAASRSPTRSTTPTREPMNYHPAPRSTGKALEAYILSHGTPVPGYPHILQLTKPMFVFKKIRANHPAHWPAVHAIANLVLPVGALLRMPETHRQSSLKMRADKAKVHSIVQLGDFKPIRRGWSSYERDFVYVVGKTVKPVCPFYMGDYDCESGIHCFANAHDAYHY